MAYNRSFRFYGIGFSTDPTGAPAEIVASVNGVEVYSGPVATINDALRPVQNPYDLDEIMFTLEDSAEYNTAFAGPMPVAITVTSGTMVIFTNVTANRWGTVPNPAFTPEQYVILDNPASTQEQIVNVLIAAANPQFTSQQEIFLLACDFSNPTQAAEANALRQEHNVEYSVHDANSWEVCFDPPAPDVCPWYITNTLSTDLDIVAFP
jgi:hypothetical protein